MTHLNAKYTFWVFLNSKAMHQTIYSIHYEFVLRKTAKKISKTWNLAFIWKSLESTSSFVFKMFESKKLNFLRSKYFGFLTKFWYIANTEILCLSNKSSGNWSFRCIKRAMTLKWRNFWQTINSYWVNLLSQKITFGFYQKKNHRNIRNISILNSTSNSQKIFHLSYLSKAWFS